LLFREPCALCLVPFLFRSRHQAGAFDDLSDLLFPLDRHDVDPPDSGNLLEALDGLHADLEAFLRLLLGRNPSMRLTTSSGTSIPATFFFMYLAIPADLRGSHSSEDIRLFGQPFVPGHGHPLFKSIQIVDALGLDELRSCSHLLGEPDDPERKRIAKGLAAAPIKSSGALVRASPPRIVPLSRMVLTTCTNWMESRSKTPTA
jgi:hypothetical protein